MIIHIPNSTQGEKHQEELLALLFKAWICTDVVSVGALLLNLNTPRGSQILDFDRIFNQKELDTPKRTNQGYQVNDSIHVQKPTLPSRVTSAWGVFKKNTLFFVRDIEASVSSKKALLVVICANDHTPKRIVVVECLKHISKLENTQVSIVNFDKSLTSWSKIMIDSIMSGILHATLPQLNINRKDQVAYLTIKNQPSLASQYPALQHCQDSNSVQIKGRLIQRFPWRYS